jgi:two-component system, NtrC family, nitrogen regulation sensor histidine kinase GlnL
MSEVTNSLWASLPVPALIVDAEDRIRDVNPAAETFLNASRRSLEGIPSGTRSSSTRPSRTPFRAFARGIRRFSSTVDVGTGSRKPVSCDVQIAPLADKPDHVL